MTSQFFDIAADLHAAMNAEFGEVVQIIPRRGGQYTAPISDSDRTPVCVVAIFSASPGRDRISGVRSGSEMMGGTKVTVTEAELWISREQTAEIGFCLQKGDGIALCARNGAPAYQIAEIHAGPMDALRLILVRDGNR